MRGRWPRRLPWSEGNSPVAGLPHERWALDLYSHADDDEYWREVAGCTRATSNGRSGTIERDQGTG